MSDGLNLQHCQDCGTVQYPQREVCGNCLSDNLEWRQTSGAGRLLSHTILRVSLEPAFQDHLPLPLALVELDAGPVVYAFADEALDRRGMAVTVHADADSIFHAGKRS